MATAVLPALVPQESHAYAGWTRIDAASLDVLDVETLVAREWTFCWRGRVVVQPRTAGIDTSDGPLALGTSIGANAGAAPVRVQAAAGSAFRVIFEDPTGPRDLLKFRVETPRVVPVEGSTIEDVFASATRILRDAEPASRRISPAHARARHFIESRLEEDFDLESLARAAGMGRCHLSRSFCRVFGVSPYRYRTHLRLARARELLVAGLGCSDAAFSVGFCDQSHLHRFFKESTGTTPGAYLRALARARTGVTFPRGSALAA